jgi:hypothetical protein
MAHFWDMICGGPFLGHLIGWPSSGSRLYVAQFWALLQLNPAVVFCLELTEYYIRIPYNWVG